jgi:aspartate racemase
MKYIGLLGGMSWKSTAEYYRIINEEVSRRLGGLHSAKIIMHSIDFHEITTLQHDECWDEAARLMVESAQLIERGGADVLLICTNTMHKMARSVERAVSIPLLHIADSTASAITDAGLDTVGLIGTRFTMEQEFYRGRLETKHGIKVLVPRQEDRRMLHSVIYDELCKGVARSSSRSQFRRVINELVSEGAQGVILGCTEISLLVGPEDGPVRLFDTTYLHAVDAVNAALT